MSGIFLRWGVPALLTVIGGTALAVSTTGGAMSDVLAERVADVLATESTGWASVSIDARDVVLAGTVADRAAVDAAAERLAAIPGVRSVQTHVTIAELASPFPFAATIADGKVTLAGGIPDETYRTELAGLADASGDELRLLAGAPPRDLWYPAVVRALEVVEHLDSGEVALADLRLTVTGRARSAADFDELNRLSDTLPDGVTLAAAEIEPPLVSPFVWRAAFDGSQLAISGFTPSEAFLERLRSHEVGGRPASTSLRLASGAPENFEQSAETLLENLVLLEDGTAEISGTTMTLSGSPPDVTTAERVRSAMTRIGARFDLAPPRVATYTFTAERTADGISLTGHVPGPELLQRLTGTSGLDASRLQLGRGAPERFESAVDYGLDLLSHMSEGRFVIEGTSLSISGRAATVADFTEVETALSLGAPQGLILAMTDVRPPLADPFTWSAVKDSAGITLSGYVPGKSAKSRLQTAAVDLAADNTTIADGSPENFEAEAGIALGLLQLLDSGAIRYDGANWAMTGAVATAEAAVAADRAFARSGLREAGWSFDIDAPPAPKPETPPVADPYVWAARKDATGIVSLSGYVPTESLHRILVARAGAGAVDELQLASGQPETFLAGTLTGIDALVQLDRGALEFDGKTWSLSGEVATVERRVALEGKLHAALDTTDWRIAIQALDAPPVVSPYVWAATKSADGHIALSGYVSTEELKQFIAVRAGENASDTTELASGEPAGFIADVLAGLEALGHLNEGVVQLKDGAWTLLGTPQTAADAELAVAALGTTASSEDRWTTELSEPVVTATPEPAPDADVANVPVEEPAPAPAEDPLPARNYAFSATKALDRSLVLQGAVPTSGVAEYIASIAGSDGAALAVARDLPSGFSVNAIVGVRLVAGLASGEFGLDGDTWILTGKVETEADKAAVMRRLAELPVTEAWDIRIDLLPSLDTCRRRVAAFASRNAILFQSGSARLAEESNAAIDELAGYLAICPDAIVHVEGHTDADGADDLNLALSVARAEAVVEALIERGVAFQRLYSVGYGESLPIADNDTAAGKRANRRIAFTILDEHQ